MQRELNALDLALGLAEYGLEKGEVLGLIGDNRPDWLMGEIAAHALGAMSLGIYRDALDAEVQFLASRGYAVLMPEFRGSTGYGAKLYQAGFKQWGQAMQTDLADAAQWAIAQGTADPQRICIAGASYGGYATLMGLAQDPGLYRCGIDWAGVSDIQLMYSVYWSDNTNEFKREGMPVLIGDPKDDAAMLEAHSPLKNASRIRQPLLLAYGAWDLRVPIVHGESLRDALRPHNSNVEWVVYPDEGHGWHKPETNLDFWGRVERFLDRQIGPGAKP
jgi:dipeptidyl aminopeptidase/acylaminoacyl peptidase